MDLEHPDQELSFSGKQKMSQNEDKPFISEEEWEEYEDWSAKFKEEEERRFPAKARASAEVRFSEVMKELIQTCDCSRSWSNCNCTQSWRDQEAVQVGLESLLKYMSVKYAWNLSIDLSYTILSTGSPIERIFLYALIVAGNRELCDIYFDYGEGPRGIPFGLDSKKIIIGPQSNIGDYRVDFLLEYIEVRHDIIVDRSREYSTKLIIECDGHDFHEKTRQQVRRDKARDRNLKSCGYEIFHFAGSEIWNNPIAYAAQAVRFLELRTAEKREEYIKNAITIHQQSNQGTQYVPKLEEEQVIQQNHIQFLKQEIEQSAIRFD